jgi:carboxypeptidase C (cathepsin A)
MKPNPNPWNAKANMLYLEAPAGVGFFFAANNESRTHNDMSSSYDSL